MIGNSIGCLGKLDNSSHDQCFSARVLGSRLGRKRSPQHQLPRGVQEAAGPSKLTLILGVLSELCKFLPSPIHL